MKKYILLFAAGGMITLASCGGETAPEAVINLDSIAAVKADSIAAALQMQSDSTLAAMASAQADSIAAAADAAVKSVKSTGKKVEKKIERKVEEVKAEVAPAPKPETVGNGKPKMGDKKDENTIGNGKPKMGNK